jgi:hypothetical protein
VNYAKGPNGTTSNGAIKGKKYYGLYEITYFPFTNEPFVPLVRHNDQYINCYIDMGEAPDGIIDPVQQADDCVQVTALLFFARLSPLTLQLHSHTLIQGVVSDDLCLCRKTL